MFDDVLKSFDGIKFFLSCITGTQSCNGKSGEVRKGISYYIVFVSTEKTDSDKIFAAFHDNNLETTVTRLRSVKDADDSRMKMLNQLSIVVKVRVNFYP